MPLSDTIYCAQQINIPPELPDILKNFTKAAIRTQPKDLLLWSVAYFSAMSKGECLPVKDRLEMNVATQKTDTGLTPGLLKILHKQAKETKKREKLHYITNKHSMLGPTPDTGIVASMHHASPLSPGPMCNKQELQKKWKGLCLPMEQLETLLSLGGFTSDINWMEFFALSCSALGGTLLSSLKFACQILTEDEEGGAARIPFSTFVKLYTYLAHVDGDMSQDHIDNFLRSLQAQVELQHGMIKPLDFIHRDDMNSTASDSSDFPRGTSRAE